MLQFFLNLLFPPRCVQCQKIGSWLCGGCSKSFEKSISCEISYYSVQGLDQVMIACRDTSHTVARFLYAWKYRRWLGAGEVLQKILARAFFDGLQTTENIVCVPIPLHAKKLASRGFNQAEVLVRELRVWSVAVLPLLLRKKATITQVGLSKEKRKENLKGAFVVNDILHQQIDRKTTIVLIDDIVTSGTTLTECANALRRHGFHHIVALVLHRGT